VRFPFDETKTTQAAAYLLKLSGGKLPYMVLIKLLYLADREMLAKQGKQITGDKLVSMKNGPVLSTVLNLINNGPEPSPSKWFDYVSEPQGYDVCLKAEAPTDALSRFEMRLLDGVYEKFGKMDRWDLVKLLHEILPEWDSDVGLSSSDIDPEDILRAEKWDERRIRDAQLSAHEARFISSLA